MGGQIVDATLVSAPRQRNTEDEKEAIKEGKSAGEIWPDKPAKAAQKDTDARWTVKFSKAKSKKDGTRAQPPVAQSHQRQLSLRADEIQERLIRNKSLLTSVEPASEQHPLQVLLGIATLLAAVPVWLGAAHQAGALILLTALLWCVYITRRKTANPPIAAG